VTVAVYLPVLVSVILAVAAGPLARRLPHRGGAWILTVAAVCAAGSGVWTLWLLSASLLDDLPGLPAGLVPAFPVNDLLSVATTVALLACLARTAVEVVRQLRHRRDTRPVLALPGGQLIVIPDQRARAFALPGSPGRIVVTDTMLKALTVAERRVLLAHEQAHLNIRHPAALGLIRLAGAANPLLRPVCHAVDFLCERDADERAGAEVGDRDLAAVALATAALAGRPGSVGPWPETVVDPAFRRLGVADRVAALQADPRSGRGARLAGALVVAVVVVGLAALASAGHATGDFAALFHAR
jgi:Peptidase family M48